MTASITEKQRQIWEAERARGLLRFLLKRFVRSALIIGLVETFHFYFKVGVSWASSYPLPWVATVYVLLGVFLSLLFLPFEWWSWDSRGRRLEGRPDSPQQMPFVLFLGGIYVGAASLFAWRAATGGPGVAVSYLLGVVGTVMIAAGVFFF